jgi:glucosamine--fructose-6-phosphate aminotransferase (isomerizing)
MAALYSSFYLVDVGGSPHYMIKEIHEEPYILKSIWEAQRQRISSIASRIAGSRIYIVGSGSSYNAGLMFHYALSFHARVPSIVVSSGEYSYYGGIISRGDSVIAISQSGYTRDTLYAAERARDSGARVIAVTNNPDSPLARISGDVIELMAGREEAITATKTFTAQLYVLLILASEISRISGGGAIEGLDQMPRVLLASISTLEPIARRISADIYRYNSSFTIGEGFGYAVAREAALKLKEASGVHAEAIQISEARHGPKTIIGRSLSVYCNIFTQSDLDSASNLARDITSTGAPMYVVSSIEVDRDVEGVSREVIRIPSIRGASISIIASSFYQLLSYYIAIARLLDPDMPRMLSKVVT